MIQCHQKFCPDCRKVKFLEGLQTLSAAHQVEIQADHSISQCGGPPTELYLFLVAWNEELTGNESFCQSKKFVAAIETDS